MGGGSSDAPIDPYHKENTKKNKMNNQKSLFVYNSLTRRKEIFRPINYPKVKMYACGVTVYDYSHLGHVRSYIVWDIVRRYLQWLGYDVEYAQNFTDVDDKILNRAKKENSTIREVTDRYIKAYFEDMDKLNISRADKYPRVTQNIDSIQRLIEKLEHRGYAYPANGDIYFEVSKFNGYGRLSNQDKSQKMSPDSKVKKNQADFALWKKSNLNEPGWDSDWGFGRPGWHIECSAMIHEHLGETIDIHAGGADLVFPHHENEIAQSQAATGKPLAKYWLHNGFVNIDGTKMSKSLDNFTTIRQLLNEANISPMAIRLFVLQAHYRQPIDFTQEAIASAEQTWKVLESALLLSGNKHSAPNDLIPEYVNLFESAMNDDFNTPRALAILLKLAKEVIRDHNLSVHEDKAVLDFSQKLNTLVVLANVLGLQATPEKSVTAVDIKEIENAIAQRQSARIAKNFKEADRIRDKLHSQGIKLIDKPHNITHWYKTSKPG
jgi:cysteinyl-tRNA synthetase